MSYITQQDLEDAVGGVEKLIQLTDDARTGQVNTDVVGRAIAYAQGVFDSYARTKYTIPVPTTEMVKAVCVDLAVLKLFRRRATTSDGVLEVKQKAHDDAVKLLQAVSAGKAALDVPTAEETETNPGSADEVLRGSSREVFTDDKLSGY